MTDVTKILQQIDSGDAAAADLLPLVYEELRKLAQAKMAAERLDHTLQATALVHEAYLRLVDQDRAQNWESRGHFFAAAAESMRRILVDNARRKMRLKRGGDWQRIDLDDPVDSREDKNLLALNEALEELKKHDPLACQAVTLRHFAGLGHQEIATALGLTVHQARMKWSYGRAWLKTAMQNE